MTFSWGPRVKGLVGEELGRDEAEKGSGFSAEVGLYKSRCPSVREGGTDGRKEPG